MVALQRSREGEEGAQLTVVPDKAHIGAFPPSPEARLFLRRGKLRLAAQASSLRHKKSLQASAARI